MPRSLCFARRVGLLLHMSVLLSACFWVESSVAGGSGSGGSKGDSTSSSRKATHAVPGRQYDGQGRFSGRLDNDGRRYDSQGRFVGRVDPQSGRQYDGQGRYLGRIESNGRQYDSQGKYLGRADGSGRLYDDQGRYKGRIDADGRQYDAQGRYTGRLDAAPVDTGVAAPAASGGTLKQQLPAPNVQTIESNRSVAPFVFCNYDDKDCGK